MKEKRRYPRVDIELPAIIDRKTIGLIQELSLKGCVIKTKKTMEKGEGVVIQIIGKKTEFTSVVITVDVEAEKFSVEFKWLDEKQRKITRDLLRAVLLVGSCEQNFNIAFALKKIGFAVLEVNDVDNLAAAIEGVDAVCVISEYEVNEKITFPIIGKLRQSGKLACPSIIYSNRHDVPSEEVKDLGLLHYSQGNTNPKKIALLVKNGVVGGKTFPA
jgi:hypothetical protein